jgi:hypothetical protein
LSRGRMTTLSQLIQQQDPKTIFISKRKLFWEIK